MKRNVGSLDRFPRIVVGITLLSIGLFPGENAWIGLIGLLPLITGILGWCPLYAALGIDTLRLGQRDGQKT
jgi:hypothetical protein